MKRKIHHGAFSPYEKDWLSWEGIVQDSWTAPCWHFGGELPLLGVRLRIETQPAMQDAGNGNKTALWNLASPESPFFSSWLGSCCNYNWLNSALLMNIKPVWKSTAAFGIVVQQRGEWKGDKPKVTVCPLGTGMGLRRWDRLGKKNNFLKSHDFINHFVLVSVNLLGECHWLAKEKGSWLSILADVLKPNYS